MPHSRQVRKHVRGPHHVESSKSRRRDDRRPSSPWYTVLYIQVLIAATLAIVPDIPIQSIAPSSASTSS